ncbi:MAG: cytochrome c-type biogenesis protein CcmH [Patiriisocius sp.]|jgi:cytochrome c-type biogenesis protein CcmH
MIRLSVFVVLLALTSPGFAAIDAYSFPNDELRNRYHTLIDELRCPQCLNTNLAGSDSMISKDLRREVHRLLLEGKTDDEVLDFMYERYGDFILYEPRVSTGTLVLWFGPLILLLLALVIGFRVANRRSSVRELTEAEQNQLAQLIDPQFTDPQFTDPAKEKN